MYVRGRDLEDPVSIMKPSLRHPAAVSRQGREKVCGSPMASKREILNMSLGIWAALMKL